MKASEIRELSAQDIRERLEGLRMSLNQMKLNHAISPIEDSSKIKKTKKDIARMLTILSQIENQNK
ncbi:MAG: 50S ribosomal protein L29 [Bacteroidales bacterium]|nr:50S ribosomal protein L29 [Candidatus Egerieousia equi]MCQ2117806.1 50S ribosomal protein L29 [Bacteroidales bacterium]